MTEDKKPNKNLDSFILDESLFKTELTPKYRNRKPWMPADNRKIIAFLPGTVRNVLVKKGDHVKKGQTVIKFEAMKMINNVQSAMDGVVKEVNIAEGSNFPKGFVLVELE
jgi:biotin carboxyl carrier protein